MGNSVHDLGGAHGFGPVAYSRQEKIFKHDWERLVFGVESACLQSGVLSLHEIRYATELMDPVAYLTSTYYEHWLAGVETPLVDKGILDWDEIDRRTQEFLDDPDRPLSEKGTAGEPSAAAGGDAEHPDFGPARFRPGDRVAINKDSPRGHTRVPRYARGHIGVIQRVNDRFELPDLAAHDLGARIEQTYQVRFSSEELWGRSAEPSSTVCLDVWESYIEPVDQQEEGSL